MGGRARTGAPQAEIARQVGRNMASLIRDECRNAAGVDNTQHAGRWCYPAPRPRPSASQTGGAGPRRLILAAGSRRWGATPLTNLGAARVDPFDALLDPGRNPGRLAHGLAPANRLAREQD